MAVKITCINKSGGNHADPHHAISHLGWKNETTVETGKSTRLEVYEWIKDKGGVAYVIDSRGNKARVGTREHSNGTKYLRHMRIAFGLTICWRYRSASNQTYANRNMSDLALKLS
jgi:hypothetical protein